MALDSDTVRLPAEVLRQLAGLSPAALAVLCRVLHRCRQEPRKCWASTETLAGDGSKLSLTTVRSALILLCAQGLLRVEQEPGRSTLTYRATDRLPLRGLDSVFIPMEAWFTLEPRALAYWAVRAALGRGTPGRCEASVQATGQLVRGERGPMSRATAYRIHAQLVRLGLLGYRPVSRKRSDRLTKGGSQVSLGLYEYGSDQDGSTEPTLSDLTHSVARACAMGRGPAICLGQVVMQACASPRACTPKQTEPKVENQDGDDGTTERRGNLAPPDRRLREPDQGPPPGLRALRGGLHSGRAAEPGGRLCAVPEGRPAGTADAPRGAGAVPDSVATGQATDLPGAFAELRRRAGTALQLVFTARTATGLPNFEEHKLSHQWAELGDDARAALPLLGDYVKAGGLGWLKQPPWKYVAANLLECLCRAKDWEAKGRPACQAGPLQPKTVAEEESLFETWDAIRPARGGNP